MKTSASLRALLAAGASATALSFALPALAQDDTTQVGEVIVTAQKKSENINDVPLAVTATGTSLMFSLRFWAVTITSPIWVSWARDGAAAIIAARATPAARLTRRMLVIAHLLFWERPADSTTG